MKKAVLLLMLPLGGCVAGALGTANAVLPLITTSLDVACASSTAIATQAKANPATAGSSAIGKVNNAVASFCGKVDPTSAQAALALNSLNTLTAQLLGVAGAAGVKLPGLAK